MTVALLAGRVVERANGTCVLLTSGGVGYRVHAEVPGDDVTLYVHEHATERGTVLYGFTDRLQLALFTSLLAVEGVGPGKAQAVVLAGADVRSAAELREVRGIGAAIATRIAEAMR